MYTFDKPYPIDDWDRWAESVPRELPSPIWQRYESVGDAGWSEAALADARRYSEEIGSAAVMVVFGGAVLTHWGPIARRYHCHSVRKSLLSALFGRHVERGTIDLGETLESLGIDDAIGLTMTEKQATVGDLLKSRSGIYLPAAYEDAKAEQNRPPRGSFGVGAHWYYNNWDFNALATVFERKTGQDVGAAFETELAAPLHMQDFERRHVYYRFEPTKSIHPAYLFRMSTRDLARIGLLYLRSGRWRETQVIPTRWIEESLTAYSETRGGGYGYMWWIEGGHLGDLGAYAAAGWGGHRLYVIPRTQLVVVHRADTFSKSQVDDEAIHRLLNMILLSRVGPVAPRARLIELDEASVSSMHDASAIPSLTSLCGDFFYRQVRAVIREVGGKLELEVPHGKYQLVRRSGTEFDVEDWNCRLEFVLDEERKPSGMRIWEPIELSAAPSPSAR
jgi:CubicO group peptidase (beta-lactamase class C family)